MESKDKVTLDKESSQSKWIRKKRENGNYNFYKSYLADLPTNILREIYQLAIKRIERDLEESMVMRDDAFYKSTAWKKLRVRILNLRGRRCEYCGQTSKDTSLHVDHKRPRWLFPELSLKEENLRVLCSMCNLGKGGKVAYHKDVWNKVVVRRLKKSEGELTATTIKRGRKPRE